MKTIVVLILLVLSFTAWGDDSSTDRLHVSLFDDYILSLQPEDTMFTDDTEYINAICIGITIIDRDERKYWYTGTSKKLVCKNSQLFEEILRSILDHKTNSDLIPLFLIRGYGEALMQCAITTRDHVIARSHYFSKLYNNCLRTYMSHPQCDQMIDIDLKIHDLNENDFLQADALERHAKQFLE